mmetsp:Transcript_16028/g.11287  ORF Transcript_16028/g.11287 Transcript_16028/m.11287 type:complete len:101 (-) Transcript_16028:490-792(-)
MMKFRRLMLKNIYILRNLNDEIINELICCMSVKRFPPGATILKSGDVADQINFLRSGEIEILVSRDLGNNEEDKNEELLFDTLNTGSAFCVYTFISDEAQ